MMKAAQLMNALCALPSPCKHALTDVLLTTTVARPVSAASAQTSLYSSVQMGVFWMGKDAPHQTACHRSNAHLSPNNAVHMVDLPTAVDA